MNPAEWSIRYNRTFLLAIGVIVALGLANFLTMPRLEDPEFTIRTAIVITVFPGGTPEDVEHLVTDPLERRIRELAEVETVLSESRSELSILQVELFEHHMETGPIWQDLRNKVNDARPLLPEGVVGPMVNDEFGDVYGIVIALTGRGYEYRELEDAAENIRDELLLVTDVASVEIWGEQEERIYVEFSNERLAELGIDPDFVIDSIAAQNAVSPAGSAVWGADRIRIEPTGQFKSVAQIREMTLAVPGRAENIRLGDIARVVRDYVDPPDVMTRFSGERAVMLAVNMSEKGRITELGERIDDKLSQIESRLPVGLGLSYAAFQPKFVEDAIGNFMINLYTAFGFVFVVMLLFTGFRTALIAGLLVPMAMLMSIALMYPFGIALQRVSISSLIISLGILVDNGVVVSESILVRLNAGEERLQAISGSVRRLALPLLAASLTTIFAFMPIATSRTIVGEYTFSLFLVIALTLFSSWTLSMTFVPFLCRYMLKKKGSGKSFESRRYRMYRSFLLPFLRYRKTGIVLITLLTVAAIFAFRQVPEIFFPPNEREMFIIDFWQPYGTDIGVTADRAARLEGFLLEQDGVASVGSFIGSGGPRWYLPLDIQQDTPNYAFFIVNTETVEDVERVLPATESFIHDAMPDTRADVKRLEHGPPVGAPIQVRLSGSDMEELYRLRDRIASVLSRTEGVINVWDNWGAWTKKVVVAVDQDKARRAGITSREIARSLYAQFSGAPVSEYRKEEDLIPILIRSTEPDALARIGDLNVFSFSSGKRVPLSQVAAVVLDSEPGNIRRRNGKRTMTVKATITGRFASEVLSDIRPAIADLQRGDTWPLGYTVAYGGEVEERVHAKTSIYAGLPLAMLLIVFVLVAKFNSFRRFLIIALTVPPMMVGITIGLFLTGAPFGFMALLGMISLTGIIINNAILMIDYIEAERKRGRGIEDAIVTAAQQRLRPIVMTAATTIMGLLPLSLRGGDMWSPLANVIIFGLAFSTILTLGLCPALYALFFGADFRDYRYDPEISGSAAGADASGRTG